MWVKFPGDNTRQQQPETAGQPQPSQQREVLIIDLPPSLYFLYLLASQVLWTYLTLLNLQYLPLSVCLSSVCLPISPDGSYTEDHNAELHFKSRSSEFDDDFDDEEPLPSIGTCKSLYPFQGILLSCTLCFLHIHTYVQTL